MSTATKPRSYNVLWKVPEGVILGDSDGEILAVPGPVVAHLEILRRTDPDAPPVYVAKTAMDRVQPVDNSGTALGPLLDINTYTAIFHGSPIAYNVRAAFYEPWHMWFIRPEPERIDIDEHYAMYGGWQAYQDMMKASEETD